MDELEKFRRCWQDELKENAYRSGSQVPQQENQLHKVPTQQNDSVQTEKTGDSNDWSINKPDDRSTPEYNNLVVVHEKNVHVIKKRTNNYAPFVMTENLLRGRNLDWKPENEPILKKSKCQNDADVEANERFLDILLKDLDEINEIPFFDLAIPREVAINIFYHLDIVDLCRCAQVSKSWKSLAEDELLWCRICHQLGYEKDSKTVEKMNWKEIAQENIKKERYLQNNWKQRIGQCFHLQYVQGGVLSSAYIKGNIVIAGYTNGQVKTWDLEMDEEHLYKPSSSALVLNEDVELGTLPNYITCVTGNKDMAVAGFSQGFVDIWTPKSGSQPSHSFHCAGAVQDVKLSEDNSILTALHNQNMSVHIEQKQKHGFVCIGSIELHEWVKKIDLIGDVKSCDSYFLAITLPDSVKLCKLGCNTSYDFTTLHEQTYDTYVSVTDFTSHLLACACHSVFEDVKIFLYCLNTRKQLATLRGMGDRVLCLNYHNSPKNMIVSGNCDKRVYVHDTRVHIPAHVFSGHGSRVTSVQMDEWKVVSGDNQGMVCVWDMRMNTKLWEVHNRHPVKQCYFNDNFLVAAHKPCNIFPNNDGFDNMVRSRERGTIQVYDFRVNQETEGVPDICLSTYDEPQAYNYNIHLAVPYDDI